MDRDHYSRTDVERALRLGAQYGTPAAETEAIIGGTACLVCGESAGEMAPIGDGPRGQVFAHLLCRQAIHGLMAARRGD